MNTIPKIWSVYLLTNGTRTYVAEQREASEGLLHG